MTATTVINAVGFKNRMIRFKKTEKYCFVLLLSESTSFVMNYQSKN